MTPAIRRLIKWELLAILLWVPLAAIHWAQDGFLGALETLAIFFVVNQLFFYIAAKPLLRQAFKDFKGLDK